MRQSTGGGVSVLDEVLRVQARYRRVRRAALAAAMLLLVVSADLWFGQEHPLRAAGTRTGVVTGYIHSCAGVLFPPITPTGARVFSAAATVEARPGREHWRPGGPGVFWEVLPARVAARESVAQNQRFRLDHLAPGRYVILARYAGGNMSTSLDVLVAADKVTDIELPNTCM